MLPPVRRGSISRGKLNPLHDNIPANRQVANVSTKIQDLEQKLAHVSHFLFEERIGKNAFNIEEERARWNVDKTTEIMEIRAQCARALDEERARWNLLKNKELAEFRASFEVEKEGALQSARETWEAEHELTINRMKDRWESDKSNELDSLNRQHAAELNDYHRLVESHRSELSQERDAYAVLCSQLEAAQQALEKLQVQAAAAKAAADTRMAQETATLEATREELNSTKLRFGIEMNAAEVSANARKSRDMAALDRAHHRLNAAEQSVVAIRKDRDCAIQSSLETGERLRRCEIQLERISEEYRFVCEAHAQCQNNQQKPPAERAKDSPSPTQEKKNEQLESLRRDFRHLEDATAAQIIELKKKLADTSDAHSACMRELSKAKTELSDLRRELQSRMLELDKEIVRRQRDLAAEETRKVELNKMTEEMAALRARVYNSNITAQSAEETMRACKIQLSQWDSERDVLIENATAVRAQLQEATRAKELVQSQLEVERAAHSTLVIQERSRNAAAAQSLAESIRARDELQNCICILKAEIESLKTIHSKASAEWSNSKASTGAQLFPPNTYLRPASSRAQRPSRPGSCSERAQGRDKELDYLSNQQRQLERQRLVNIIFYISDAGYCSNFSSICVGFSSHGATDAIRGYLSLM
jgi:hypothetical protein